jgi:DNA-binding NarL/FixJ family response regulator
MRAVVIEDQTLMRDYFGALLRKHCGATEVISIGSMKELAQRGPELENVRLILFDIDLGDGSTLDWALARAGRDGSAALVAVSSIGAHFPFKQLQGAGISLAHKNDGEKELVDLIRRALTGAVVISRRVMELVNAGARDPQSPLKFLGPREQQVLGLLGQRLANEEIAALLGCTASNVADHRKRIMRKLDLHNIEQLIDCAIRHGLIYDSRVAAVKPRFTP